MQIASERGLAVSERHENRPAHMESVRLELETDTGVTSVEGAIVLDKPRLVQVDGIQCEAPLEGHVTFMKNEDVPGVIGYIGGVLGKHGINIANFSLGRGDKPSKDGEPLEAISVVETDSSVPDKVLEELLSRSALKLARTVEFDAQAGAAAS